MDSFLNLDKPAGLTSHDAVSRLRRASGIMRIGHAGTLDPDATGVLLIAVNRATRLLPYLDLEPKVYHAWLRFGTSTRTQDASGEVIEHRDASHISEAMVRETLKRFQGVIQQIPPMYSAVHHQGQRLYELARKGIEVEREAREVTIFSINLLSFEPGESPLARLEASCSGGTYVRTLCHDIGEVLKVGGHMEKLIRTAVGHFNIENSYPLSELASLEAMRDASEGLIRSVWPEGGPAFVADADQRERIINGNSLLIKTGFDKPILKPFPVLSEQNEILAFATYDSYTLQPVIVFNAPFPFA